MPIVNIPNVGPVNFPDNMSQDAILMAIQNDILPKFAQEQPAAAEEPKAAEKKPMGVLDAINDVLTPSQALLGAGEKGIVNAKQAASNAQLAQLINNQEADKKQYGEYYEGAPASELDKITARDKAIQEKIQNLATFGLERKAIEEKRGVNPLTQALTNLRGSEEYKTADNFDQLKMLGNTMWAKKGDLGGYAAGIALESLPSSIPTIAAAMAAKFGGMGPAGAAIMGGAGSALTEFGNQYAELRAEGKDHKEAWEEAGVKSAVIGLFDGASFKSAGNSAGQLFKSIEKGFVKEAVKETGKAVSKQALYGMAGEALGSVAINQKIDPLSVIEEGIGEVAGAPLEAISTFKSKQQEAAANQPAPAPNREQELATIAATLKEKYNLSDERALQQAGEVLRQQDIVKQTQQPPAEPAPQVQVKTVEGTPITPVPLDTAAKQAAAPIQPPAQTQSLPPDIQAAAQAKANELGIPLADAQKLVAEETQNGRPQPSLGAVPGVNQPSVSMPEAGLQYAQGVATPEPGRLANPVGPTAVLGEGTEAVQAAQPTPLIDTKDVKQLNNLTRNLEKAKATLDKVQNSQVRGGPEEIKAAANVAKAEEKYIGFMDVINQKYPKPEPAGLPEIAQPKTLEITPSTTQPIGEEKLFNASGYGTFAQLITYDGGKTYAVTSLKAEEPGKGNGSKFMKDLTDWADTNNVTLELTAAADPYLVRTKNAPKQKQLTDWYSKNGFNEPKEGDRWQTRVRTPIPQADPTSPAITTEEIAATAAPVEETTLATPISPVVTQPDSIETYFDTKNKLTGRMDEILAENDKLLQSTTDLKNQGIDEGDSHKYDDAIDAAKAKYEENGKEFDGIYKQIQELQVPFDPTAPIPTATKGKRTTGRPRTELTPEEQVAKKQAKAAQTKEWKATDKTITAAKTVLDNPEPVREDFKTQDAYLEAGMRYRSERNQALDTLYAVANGPQRAGKLGATAKVGLDNPSISVQERNNLQQRVELKKKAVASVGKPSKSQIEGNSAPDSKFDTFETATQAANYIERTGNPFESLLAKRLKPFLKDVNLFVINAANQVPEEIQTFFDGANGVYAVSGVGVKTIYLRGEPFGSASYQGTNKTVFLHEALHAAVNAKIDEWLSYLENDLEIPQKLGDAINGLISVMEAAQREYAYRKLFGIPMDPRIDQLFTNRAQGGVQMYDDLKEFVSYGLTEDSMQEFLLDTKGEIVPNQPGRFKSLFNRFVNSIRELFDMDDSHQSAFQDLIVLTEGLLKYEGKGPTLPQMSAARTKKTKAQKLDKDIKKVMTSQETLEVTAGLGGVIEDGHGFQDMKDYLQARFKGMKLDAIETLLYSLRTSDIIRWIGDQIPGLSQIDEITQKMAAMRGNMLAAYAKKADSLARFVVNKKGNMQVIGNAMHLARLKGVTPDAHPTAIEAVNNDPKVNELTKLIDDPATDAARLPALKRLRTIRKNDIQVVYDAWNALGKIPGGHEMYKMVRQFYKDNYALTRNLLDERIDRLKELPGDKDDESTPKGKLMAEIRKMQEQDNIQEYFPLMRHGTVWLRESGPNRGFYMFDSNTEREAFKIKQARQAGTTVEELFGDPKFNEGNMTDLRNTNARESIMLKNMFDIVDGAKLDEISAEDLKDQLYQTYLTTLPEISFRKQFIHAENVTGFSADIFRNFTESANRMASQIPRLKYSDQMEAQITRAKDSLEGNPDKAKLGLFIDAVSRRAQEQLSPPEPNKIAAVATRYAYYMLLTGAMSAAVQLVAVPVMVYPALAVRYGVGKASAKFAAYSNVLNSMGVESGTTPDSIPYVTASVGESARVRNNETLNSAFNELKERGLFAFTENNLLSQRSRTPLNATTNMPKKALRITANIMSGLFSGSERVSREIASMMAFELHYDKTKNFEESIEKAIAAVQDNMGRYDAMERPELFKYAPVISQFKMYALGMTSFFVRNAYNSVKGIATRDPKLASESIGILTGVLMMGAMFHGLKGMPLYSTVGAALAAFDNPENDDEERRRRRMQDPLVESNPDLRFRRFLNDHFGEIGVPGIDGKVHKLSDVMYSGPISALTDVNVGSRTSFDNLWFRGGQPSKTNVEAFNNFLLANLGPAVSGLLGQAGAIDDFENGHIERGIEKMLPAFFKNPLVATRFAIEGSKTKRGDMVIAPEDITAANILFQAAGAPPTRLARQQEAGYGVKGEYIKAQQDRTKLLSRLNDAIINKDFSGSKRDIQPYVNQISQFNKKFAGMEELEVDIDTLERTLDAALDARSLTYKGTRIPTEKMIPYFMPALRAANTIKQ